MVVKVKVVVVENMWMWNMWSDIKMKRRGE
jgi:hypothetical protein